MEEAKKDTYERDLEEKTTKLLECREEKKLNSCSQCDKFFECEIRKKYVRAVYDSMSKGGAGSFDF